MKKCNSLLRKLASGAVSLPQTSVSVRNPFSTNRPGAGPMRARRNPTRAPGPWYPVTGLRFCTARPSATALLHVSDVPEERGEIIPCFNQLDSGALRLNTEACKFNNAGSRWKKSWILIWRPESLCKQCRHFIDDDGRPFLPDVRQLSSRRAVRFYRLRPVMTLMTFLQLITTHGSVPVVTICAAGLFIAAQSVLVWFIVCACPFPPDRLRC